MRSNIWLEYLSETVYLYELEGFILLLNRAQDTDSLFINLNSRYLSSVLCLIYERKFIFVCVKIFYSYKPNIF